MQRNAERDGQPPRDGNQRELSQRDLEKMLRDLENMARQGDRDMAQQMLNELRDMLERLQPGGSRQADGQGQELMEMMDEFGNIIGREQQLLDDTFKQQRRRGERGDRGDKGKRG
ncbi:MAG TPA: DUF4175 family protein, partial [Hyphomicrobiaceae bacterium]|nr:DUF4175 family protein [Hyphomicrobiaceae bacterium]